MKLKPQKKVHEFFLVVEGSGRFPFDMLRYDACWPYDESDSHTLEREDERNRRVVLCRRSVNDKECTRERWQSFGWSVLCATQDAMVAIDVRERRSQ